LVLDFDRLRVEMVEEQIRARGIRDEALLSAFARVPRHLFVPEEERRWAYGDHPLPIGYGQTISQPYMVAVMTRELKVRPGLKVLEVGTGSGYQAAILAEMGCEVFSVERIEPLYLRALRLLGELGYLGRVRLKLGDGSLGWPEEAPFDRIVVTAAAERIPEALVEQLSPGGVLVAPIGGPLFQELHVCVKTEEGLKVKVGEGCRFVPLLKGVEISSKDREV